MLRLNVSQQLCFWNDNTSISLSEKRKIYVQTIYRDTKETPQQDMAQLSNLKKQLERVHANTKLTARDDAANEQKRWWRQQVEVTEVGFLWICHDDAWTPQSDQPYD